MNFQLTPRRRLLLEKLEVGHVVKKIPAICATWKLSATYRRACQPG
jgi:hypothetical protein